MLSTLVDRVVIPSLVEVMEWHNWRGLDELADLDEIRQDVQHIQEILLITLWVLKVYDFDTITSHLISSLENSNIDPSRKQHSLQDKMFAKGGP